MEVLKIMFWDTVNKRMLTDYDLEKICASQDLDISNYETLLFTGFTDSEGSEIYDGHIISDWTDCDGEQVQSFNKVFWNVLTGSWHLDFSLEQNTSDSMELWMALDKWKFKITGNIYTK